MYRSKNKIGKWFFLSSVLLCFSVVQGCSKSESKDDKKKDASSTAKISPALTVTTESIQQKDISRTLNVTGSLAAWDMLSVKSPANGLKLLDIYVESGDYVKKGQLLVRLDDSMILAQLQSARARLANVQAQLQKAKKPNRSQEVETQKALIDQIEASLKNAKDNMERFASLNKQGAVSKADYDLRKTTYDTNEAQLRQAQERLSLMLEGSRKEDISIAESSVADSMAQIAQLNVQLNQTKIYAPDDGLIMERFAKLGDVSSSAMNLFTMVRKNRFELQAKVPETDLKNIKVGGTVTITSDANEKLKTTGKVRQIGPLVDQNTRQAIVKIDVDYKKGMLTGQFMKGEISLGKVNSFVVPAKAILNTEGISKIFVVKDSMAILKTIKTGANSGDFIEVKSGLSDKDKIIVNGVGFLRDGDTVKVVTDKAKGE